MKWISNELFLRFSTIQLDHFSNNMIIKRCKQTYIICSPQFYCLCKRRKILEAIRRRKKNLSTVRTTPAIKKLIAVVNDAGEMPRLHGRNHISNLLSFHVFKIPRPFLKSKAVWTRVRTGGLRCFFLNRQTRCKSMRISYYHYTWIFSLFL